MKFIKDILIFDVTTTGNNLDKDQIIQLSAVLVNKDNFLGQDFFNNYVRVSLLDGTINQHAQMLNISFEELRSSKKIYDVVKLFDEKFGKEYLLACVNPLGLSFLRQAYKKSSIPFLFDEHVLDIWTLGYIFTLRHGIKKMPSFETMVDFLGLKLKNNNDANEKAKLASLLLKHIINSTYFHAT
jgi:DNA polymerase III alpha subunit (gram-positive type)